MTFGFLRTSAVCLVATVALAACGKSEPKIQADGPAVRRLTETQYRNVIADLFGSNVTVVGRFDPLLRENGLSTTGAWDAKITPAGIEQFERMARNVADQVVSPANRDVLIPCTPAAADKADDACATEFFAKTGRLLLRHPLPPEQVQMTVALANKAATTFGDFYRGMGVGLASLLVSPSFLYIIDTVETDKDGGARLNAYAKASRLSFLLWNSTPDDALLTAAEKGELDTKAGVKKHAERLIASPRLESGVRAFFGDMLGLDQFEGIEKDTIIYPTFSLAVARDAKEQALRTISSLLLTERGDYRDLFTTRKTFISGQLGRIYQVPVARPDGGWTAYEFPADDPRSGLVTQIAFAAQYSHPGRSSPTLRGRAIREALLCQRVPDPPGDVDFSQFNGPDGTNKTTRQKLDEHSENPSCAGCHKITDPIGLALEKIDGAGQFRQTDNDSPIDTSGDLDGVKYQDAIGLGKALHDNPAIPSCVVQRLYAYATGRTPGAATDKELVKYFGEAFVADGYRIPDLMRRIAVSDAFMAVSAPKPHDAARKSASATPGYEEESKS